MILRGRGGRSAKKSTVLHSTEGPFAVLHDHGVPQTDLQYWWFGQNKLGARCDAYSSLTTGLFYWQPWFKRDILGATEVLSLQGLGVADVRGQY
jgi:hypothetical protein